MGLKRPSTSGMTMSCLPVTGEMARLDLRRPQTAPGLGGVPAREGVIRDIHILGILSDMLVVAFKGQGTVKVNLQHASSDSLEGEVAKWVAAYDKFLPDSKQYQFMEFDAPRHLPATIVIVGETDPMHRPCPFKMHTESRLQARISCCGQVISHVQHLPT